MAQIINNRTFWPQRPSSAVRLFDWLVWIPVSCSNSKQPDDDCTISKLGLNAEGLESFSLCICVLIIFVRG